MKYIIAFIVIALFIVGVTIGITLEKKGFIEVYSADEGSRKKKEYIITESGRSAFMDETKRLTELLENSKLMD